MGAADERTLDRGRVFGLDREPAEQAGECPPKDNREGRASPCALGQVERDQRRAGNEQIVEDRRLPAAPTQQRQPDQIASARRQRAGPARPGPQCRAPDDIGGRGGEQARDQLIGDHAIAGQQPHRGIEQEQPDRLAIPDIEIGCRAVQDAVADQQIILLVDMDDRIAEIPGAQGKRDDREHRRHLPGPETIQPACAQ